MVEEVSVGAWAALLLAATTAAGETTLPCRQPQMAASGNVVYVTCGTPTSILVARSEDGGRTFAPTAKVATVATLSLGNHRGPRIVALGDTLVVSAIVGEVGGGKDGDVVAWRSTDRGTHWSTPVKVNDVPAAAREGLHAMAANGRTVTAAWLDLREKGTTLVVAVSQDAGVHWGPNIVAYRSPSGSICQCCHPSLVIDASGRITAMFRNEREGARDMHLVASADAGRTWSGAEKLGRGTWPLKTCPMDGGALGLDSRGGIVTTWRREHTVYLATPEAAEVALGAGVNPTLTMTTAGPLVAWNGAEGLMLTRADASAALVDAHGRFAALVTTPDGVVLAFERGMETVVRRN